MAAGTDFRCALGGHCGRTRLEPAGGGVREGRATARFRCVEYLSGGRAGRCFLLAVFKDARHSRGSSETPRPPVAKTLPLAASGRSRPNRRETRGDRRRAALPVRVAGCREIVREQHWQDAAGYRLGGGKLSLTFFCPCNFCRFV